MSLAGEFVNSFAWPHTSVASQGCCGLAFVAWLGASWYGYYMVWSLAILGVPSHLGSLWIRDGSCFAFHVELTVVASAVPSLCRCAGYIGLPLDPGSPPSTKAGSWLQVSLAIVVGWHWAQLVRGCRTGSGWNQYVVFIELGVVLHADGHLIRPVYWEALLCED